MVECARLERVCALIAYREFESHPLRHSPIDLIRGLGSSHLSVARAANIKKHFLDEFIDHD